MPRPSFFSTSNFEKVARGSGWVRAPESGIFRAIRGLGSHVEEGEVLGIIADPFGDAETKVTSAYSGIVVGRTNLPLVHQGEALYHIALFDTPQVVVEQLEALQSIHDVPMSTGSEPSRV